jgi:hypothetical protein
MAAFGQVISSLFLKEFVSAFFLSMRYFFAPKATLNYPFEKGPNGRVSGQWCWTLEGSTQVPVRTNQATLHGGTTD